MATLIHERVAAARAGTNPTVIARMASGWAVLGDSQFFRGYCLLLADPVVPSLNALGEAERRQFLSDMAAVGDAILRVTGAVRVNYEILGNTDPALHAHLFPRGADEPMPERAAPVWRYPEERRCSVPFDARRDRPLMDELAAFLRAASRA